MFFCLILIQLEEFSDALDSILIKENGLKLVPELYTVPADKVYFVLTF